MLKIRGMQSISSLPLIPSPFWRGVAAPDRVLSIGQVGLFKLCTKTFKLRANE